MVPADPSNPESWSGENKLAVVIETAALNEQELAEYCRRKGLNPEQIQPWREAAAGGNDDTQRLSPAERRELQAERKKTRRLEKELRRKDKALAEAGALLVLQKKPRPSGGRRGRVIMSEDPQMAIDLMAEACAAGARQARACAVVGIDVRTLRRWHSQQRDEQRLVDRRREVAADRPRRLSRWLSLSLCGFFIAPQGLA